ncbi:major facilitator superfamily domain-containing protein 12 [Cucumis melo var. makuwa]|uniref:Major facilitator superfamily domain-containing protein 12 n=2 Tax=Cucumis melo TaxID=3656 RepID=A0A5D3CGX6_CUCMM|nr:major facilitator superfamily domain-containing protein 12 [Cucumis melo var. makuwa]
MEGFRLCFKWFLLMLLLLLLRSPSSVRFVGGDDKKDKEECTPQLAGMATCLPYVSGDAKTPTPDCCSGLKEVLKNNKKCLCVIVKDRNDPDLGLQINVTLALGLPDICHATANVSNCPALLNLPSNSSEAQVFYQLGKGKSSSALPPAPIISPSSPATISSTGQQKMIFWVIETKFVSAISTMSNDDESSLSHTQPIGRWSIFCFGLGHMLNDITAACWFTYLLLFLTDIGLSPGNAATVMLSGQVADGVTTIFAGELIDRFGHLKIWHGAGSVLVAVSFSSVFGGCLPCIFYSRSSSTLQTVGYSFFAAIFNVGWAATQVSHMSMVNCITLNSTSRVALASCRNAFNMVANLSLYAVALLVFSITKAKSHTDIEYQYRVIAYISIFIGCCFVVIFLVGTKEPSLKVAVQGNRGTRISWSYWFKKVLYYQVALAYVLTRLIVNVSQAFLAYYVINDLHMAQSATALVPAIIYVFSFIISVVLQEVVWTGQRLKIYYSAGGIIWMFCGAAILILPSSLSAFMYVMSTFIGIANALMMVTGVSMQSVLVGTDLNGCAFVCGSLSFLDKISCGLALYFLESFQSSTALHVSENTPLNATYISVTRYGLGLVPAVCAFLGVAVTISMNLGAPYAKYLTESLLE